MHLTRFHGVFTPIRHMRAQVTPRNRGRVCGERKGTHHQRACPTISDVVRRCLEACQALERAGLVRCIVQGRTHFCRLDPKPLAGAAEWLSFYERFWKERLDALEELLCHPDKE